MNVLHTIGSICLILIVVFQIMTWTGHDYHWFREKRRRKKEEQK